MQNMLERKTEKKFGTNSGATMVGALVGLIIGIVLVVAVAIPIATNVIASANITDPTTVTVLNVIPVMLAIVPVVLVAQLF